MGNLHGRSGFLRRSAYPATASMFLLMNIENAYANCACYSVSQYGSSLQGGSAAMLRFQIPLGSGFRNGAQPAVSLSLGSLWGDVSGSPNLAAYRFVPSLEAGLTLQGQSVLKLGAVDVLHANGDANANGEAGPLPTWAWVLLGVGAAAGLAVALSSNGSQNYQLAPPCGPPIPCPPGRPEGSSTVCRPC